MFKPFLKYFMLINWQLRSIYLAFLLIFIAGAGLIAILENLSF